MRRLLAVAVAAWSAAVLVSAQAPKPKTVWDGVYTETQAARGTADVRQRLLAVPHVDAGQGETAR